MSPLEWLLQIAERARGRVWRANAEFDVARRRLPPASWDVFLREICDSSVAAGDATDPLSLIDEAIRKRPLEFLLRGPDFRGERAPYSRIVDMPTFARFNVSRDLGLETDENTDGRLLALMEAGIFRPRHHAGEMKTRQDFFWCTTSEALDELARRCVGDELAAEIRDCLGLGTWPAGVHMLRIDVPRPALGGKRVCAPTVLDAGSNAYFTPHEDPNGYGWTLHLARLEPGAPELLVEKLTFDETWTVVRVGQVSRLSPAFDWDRWADRCSARASSATVATLVKPPAQAAEAMQTAALADPKS